MLTRVGIKIDAGQTQSAPRAADVMRRIEIASMAASRNTVAQPLNPPVSPGALHVIHELRSRSPPGTTAGRRAWRPAFARPSSEAQPRRFIDGCYLLQQAEVGTEMRHGSAALKQPVLPLMRPSEVEAATGNRPPRFAAKSSSQQRAVPQPAVEQRDEDESRDFSLNDKTRLPTTTAIVAPSLHLTPNAGSSDELSGRYAGILDRLEKDPNLKGQLEKEGIR